MFCCFFGLVLNLSVDLNRHSRVSRRDAHSQAEKARTAWDATKGKRSICLLPHHEYQCPNKTSLFTQKVQFGKKHKKAYLSFIVEI